VKKQIEEILKDFIVGADGYWENSEISETADKIIKIKKSNEPKIDYFRTELERRIEFARSKLTVDENDIVHLLDKEEAWHGALSSLKWVYTSLYGQNPSDKRSIMLVGRQM
jgi:hypothetical protein